MNVQAVLGVQQSAFHKAVRPDTLAPKRKHVRKIIVDTWNYGKIDVFKEMEKEPLNKNACVCFKSFTVLHKVLQEGAPRFLKRAYGALHLIRYLQNFWASSGAVDPHYGKLNAEYAYFLRGKITFHHKHPLVIGTLALDDYKKKIQNQPEVPLHVRQQMVSHLLDLQEMILRLQDAIFVYHGRDLHEAKKAALVPLIVESDAVLRITVHHLNCLCERVADGSQVEKYLRRFNEHYPRLRLFFDNTSRIPYVTDLVRVPTLPGEPPKFHATGNLAHLVPEPDQVITIASLMLDDDTDEGNPPSLPPKPLENPQFRGTNLPSGFQSPAQSGNFQPSSFQSSPVVENKQPVSQPAGWISFDAPPPQTSTPVSQTPQVATTTEVKSVPTGWIDFNAPPAPQTAQITPVSVPKEEPKEEPKQPETVAAVNNPPDSEEMNEIRQRLSNLENIVREKDEQANYWRQMCEHMQSQLDAANRASLENAQRAEDLEQHLQDLMQQQQREKEARLLRKLEASVGSVSSALARFADSSELSNLSSTPEQILEANKKLAQGLESVESAAMSRDHESLISATKEIVLASNAQTEHSRGVAYLTDDPDLRKLLLDSAQNTGDAIQKLLEAIRDDPYDADPILSQVVNVRSASESLEHATLKIVDAEKVDDGAEGLADQASQELLNAAKVIEDAARLLIEAKKRAEEQAKDKDKKYKMEVASTIVGAAMAITDATGTLVKHATVLQKENVETGRAHAGGALYKKDLTWSEGLISAAKSVAASVQEVVNKANGTVSEQVESEELIVASKQVAAATAQLLVSSRVRSDPNSQAQKNLENASRAVTQATRALVLASQSDVKHIAETVEEDTQNMLSGLSMTEVKIREMEQQANILRLEKQLETERIRLAQMRKNQYK